MLVFFVLLARSLGIRQEHVVLGRINIWSGILGSFLGFLLFLVLFCLDGGGVFRGWITASCRIRA